MIKFIFALLFSSTVFAQQNGWIDLGGGGSGGGVTSVTATSPILSSGGLTPNITCLVASGSQNGCLLSVDWNTFNNKQNALTFGSVSTTTTGLSIGNGANSTVGPNVTVNVQTASGSQPGLLSSTDWNTFNNKQAAGNYITGLTGDVVATGPGSVASTIQSNVVSNSKLAQMGANTIKGNNTGSTANSSDLTAAQITAMLNPFIGDSGSGGTQGLVPAPAAVSAEQGNFLEANGSFSFVDVSKNRYQPFKLLSQTALPSGTVKAQNVQIYTYQNNTYALVSGGNSTATISIYNITDQSSPQLRGNITLAGSYGVIVAIVAGVPWAIVPSSGASHLYTVNLSNPNSLSIGGNLLITGTPGALYSAAYANGYIYLSTQSQGLTAVDVGGGSGSMIAPVQVFQEGGGVKSFGVLVSGSTLYTTNYQTTFPATVRYLKTWSLSTPSTPSLQNTYTIPGGPTATSTKPGNMSISGNSLFITDINQNVFDIVDVTTPTAPNYLSYMTPSATPQPGSIAKISGNYAYLSTGANATYGGVVDFFDITNLSSPIKIASVTSGIANAVYGGLDLSSGYIYAANYGVSPGSAGSLDIYSNPLETIVGGSATLSNLTVINGISGSLAYSPATPANWSVVPTTLNGGLDGLASTGIYVSQAQNLFFASPNGSSGLMVPRAIVAADVPTLNQNTTGTASNITATSNSTLTTLSSLSLPGSQVTGNISGNSANVTGTVLIANGGTGQTSASAAFNALSPITSTGDLILGNGTNSATRLPIGSNTFILTSNGTTASWQAQSPGFLNPMTTLGDIIYENATPAAARLAGNTSATKNFLSQTGTGSVSAAPGWSVLASGDIPNNAANTTGTASNITGLLAIANGGTNNATLPITAGGVLYTDGTKVQNTGAGTASYLLQSNGSSAPSWVQTVQSTIPPTIQKFLSGSGTYTTPTNPAPLYIKIKVAGGGGGASGNAVSGGGAGNGTAGTQSTFGSSLLTAGGGGGGSFQVGTYAAGGTNTINSPAIQLVSAVGGDGGSYAQTSPSIASSIIGPAGGMNPLGGAGPNGGFNSNGDNASSNTGAGGGAPGCNASASYQLTGNSGAAGGYLEAIINNPGASYSYSVGAGGGGGAAGSGGTGSGGSGGSGVIIVEEYYGTLGSAVSAQASYAQAYFGAASSWTTTSASFADPSNSGGNTLNIRKSSGITLTAAASNLPGITFTPASSNAVYQIIASFGAYNSNSGGSVITQLTDGTTTIVVSGTESPGFAGGQSNTTLSGIYVPGTTSPVTVKLQALTIGGVGTVNIVGNSPGITVEWTITRIDSLAVSGASGISRSVNSISTPQTAGSAASTDYYYNVSGTTTLTLPTAVGNTNLYVIKNTGVATVTIATTSSQTIDGSSTATISVANTSLTLLSDGSNWRIQ